MKTIITFILLCFFIEHNKAQVSTCSDSIGLFTLAKYPVGTAIDINELENNPLYKSIALKQFNSITPENIFKAENIHPKASQFNWKQADRLAAFCVANNKRLYGHTLIWHNQLPQWILDFQGNSSEWEQLMKNHIQTIVTHFKGKVTAWDVVNEAFNEDGTLRDNIWKQKIGDSYIEKAFLYAHKADPDAFLFYNDYNLESNPTKLKSVLSFLNNLRKKGLKINGIGLQMHISTEYPKPSQIAKAFREIATDNYKIHLSELDISINPNNQNIEPTEKKLAQQANLLESIVLNYNQLPTQYKFGITFWGIADKNSWIRYFYRRNDYPLLYDDSYLPKPCYCKLIETLPKK